MTKRTQIILATAAAAASIATIVMLVLPGGTRSRTPQAVSVSIACPPTAESSTLPTAPPPDLQWKAIGALEVPTSATAGPARYQGDVWKCFAHSPTGAVMAAYDIVASLVSSQWLTAARDEIAPGPGQQAYIAATQSQTLPSLTPGQVAQPVGFEVVTYTSAQATVETLAAAGNDEYQADQRTLTWVDGDWKVLMTSAGTLGPDPQLVTSSDGFVLWAGENNG